MKGSCHAERSRSGFVMEERYNDVKGFHRGAQWITELHRGRKPKPTTHKITFAKIPGKINCFLFSVYLCACSVILCVTYAGTPGLFGIAGMYNEAMFHSYNVRRLQGVEEFEEFEGFEMFTCGELPARCRRGFARLKGLKCFGFQKFLSR